MLLFQTVSDSGGRGRIWGGGSSDQKVHYYVVNLIPVCFFRHDLHPALPSPPTAATTTATTITTTTITTATLMTSMAPTTTTTFFNFLDTEKLIFLSLDQNNDVPIIGLLLAYRRKPHRKVVKTIFDSLSDTNRKKIVQL